MLQDGGFHVVDSSELAFKLCAIGAFRDVYKNTKPVILEPIMNVEVVAPLEFQSKFTPSTVLHFECMTNAVWCTGNVIGGLNSRRGTIVDTEIRDDEFTCLAEVALNDMFGYSNQLRGATQGKGEFSMEYKVSFLSCSMSRLITDFIGCRTICLCCRMCRRIWRRRIRRRCLRRKSRLEWGGCLLIRLC